MNMPGFNAISSLYRSTRSYQAKASRISSEMSSSIMPQARAIGGFGGGFGEIKPPEPTCTECHKVCTPYPCGPDCIGERCDWPCVSVPCRTSPA